MGLVDLSNKIKSKKSRRSSGGFSGFSGFGGGRDLKTLEGLRSLAEEVGVEEKKSLFDRIRGAGRGVLGGVEKVANIIRTGEFAVGGLIAGEGIKEGVEKKISPSDVILDEWQPKSFLGKAAKFVPSLALDVAFDPLTYATLGAGSALKIATKEGTEALVSKTGTELTKELAEEVGTKAAKEHVASLASAKSGNIISRGGLKNIKRGLEKTGKEFTKENVDKVLSGGIKELRASEGLKFMGKELASKEALKKPVDYVVRVGEKTKLGKPLIDGSRKIRDTFAGLFKRDFGLTPKFKKLKQKSIDAFDKRAGDISKQVSATFLGTTKAQRKLMTYAIGKERIKDIPTDVRMLLPQSVIKSSHRLSIEQLPESLRPLAKRTKGILDGIRKSEESRGLLDQTIQDYVPFIYKNQKEAKKIARAISGGQGTVRAGQANAVLKFGKSRSLPSIGEARKIGLDPEDDIAKLLESRLLGSEKAKITQDLYGNLIKKTAVKREASDDFVRTAKDSIVNWQDDYIKLTDAVSGAPKGLGAKLGIKKPGRILIPRSTAEDLASLNKNILNDENVSQLLSWYVGALNFFKGSVTVFFPAFHGRNAISNVAQSFLDSAVGAIDPAIHKAAVKIMTKQEGELVTKLGDKIAYSELRKVAREKQVFQDVLRITDVGRRLEKGIIKKPSKAVGAARAVGRGVENEARLANFLVNIRRGMDFDQAADRTKKFLFDYDNLSNFEKKAMRNIIPFYTWERKNIALQLEALVKQPGKVAGQFKALKAIEEMFDVPDSEEIKKFAPDWVAAGLSIVSNHENDDVSFLVGFGLPVEAAFDWANEPFKKIGSSLSPFIKSPIELSTGFNFFKQEQISEDDSGKFAEKYPQVLKDALGFRQDTFTKDGKEITVSKVNPEKKWTFQTFASFFGLGRVVSTASVDFVSENINILHAWLTGEDKITKDTAWTYLRNTTGINRYEFSLEGLKNAKRKEKIEQIKARLIESGEMNVFEIPFVPGESSGFKGF